MTHEFTFYYSIIFFCHFLPSSCCVIFCEWFVAATAFEIKTHSGQGYTEVFLFLIEWACDNQCDGYLREKKKYRRCQQVSKKYGTGRDWTNLEIDKMGMWVFLQFKHFSFLGQSKTTDKASSSLFIGVNCNFSWDSMN